MSETMAIWIGVGSRILTILSFLLMGSDDWFWFGAVGVVTFFFIGEIISATSPSLVDSLGYDAWELDE